MWTSRTGTPHSVSRARGGSRRRLRGKNTYTAAAVSFELTRLYYYIIFTIYILYMYRETLDPDRYVRNLSILVHAHVFIAYKYFFFFLSFFSFFFFYI